MLHSHESMTDFVIENPILNSPYGEPSRHFKFADDGITNEIVEELWLPHSELFTRYAPI
jgi:hypothetical protein